MSMAHSIMLLTILLVTIFAHPGQAFALLPCAMPCIPSEFLKGNDPDGSSYVCSSDSTFKEYIMCARRSCNSAAAPALEIVSLSKCHDEGGRYSLPSGSEASHIASPGPSLLSSSPQRGPPIGILVGIIVGVNFAIISGACVTVFLRRRRKKNQEVKGAQFEAQIDPFYRGPGDLILTDAGPSHKSVTCPSSPSVSSRTSTFHKLRPISCPVAINEPVPPYTP